MRCLVTGVAGFIGSHLAERLIEDGHEVIGIDTFVEDYSRSLKLANLEHISLSPHFRLIEGDLNCICLPEIVQDREWIFHHAAHAGVRSSWGAEFELYTTCNVLATQRLLEAAKRARDLKRMIYASSSSVYSDHSNLPVTEDTPTRPKSPYGVTKLAAEQLCRLYWENFGLPVVCLRYFTVYGPRQRPDMAFYRICRALLSGREFPLNGDGTQTRNFTYVTDVVEANILAVHAGGIDGQVMNIAGAVSVTLRDAIRMLEVLSNRRVRLVYLDVAAGDAHSMHASIERAHQLLGYAPQVSLRAGLALQLDYMRDSSIDGIETK